MLLNSLPVIEDFNIFENDLSGFFNCSEMPPMYSFLFHIGKKAFAPSIIPGLTNSGKTLFDTVPLEKIHYIF